MQQETAKAVVKPAKLPLPSPQTPAASNQAASSPAKAAKPAVKPTETSAAENSGKPVEPVTSDTGARWYLNVGTFGQKPNALNLLDSLKQQGFAATLKEFTGEKGTVYKVRIGPMLDKSKAQAMKNKLTQININSFVASDE